MILRMNLIKTGGLYNMEFFQGDEVFYKDIDDDISTGYYVIREFITDDIVLLCDNHGRELEAYLTELS